MAECILGLYKGIEQHRNVPYCALWTQVEGLEQQMIFRIAITRTNHGNVYLWNGPEVQKLGSRIEGFVTGRPEKIVIGNGKVDVSKIEAWAAEVTARRVLPPHEFVVALLERIEASGTFRHITQSRWSTIVQEWTDTQDMVIPSKRDAERMRRPYGNRLVEKYDSSHNMLENCPITDGVIMVSEQRKFYDPRSPPTTDPVRDGLFRRGGSRTPSPLQSPTVASASFRSQMDEPAFNTLHRASTMPLRTRSPPSPLPLRASQSQSPGRKSAVASPQLQSPRRASIFGYTNASNDLYSQHQPQPQSKQPLHRRRHDSFPNSMIHELDPRLRPSQARRRAMSISQDLYIKTPGSSSSRPPPPSAFRPPRSKTDRRRSESRQCENEKGTQQVDVVTTVLTVLAATAMAVV